jgi:hypothetical protein
MKKTVLLFIFFTCSLSISFFVGQNLKYPSWINGTWQNSLVSDTLKFVFWTFAKDSIFVENGLHLNKSEKNS